MVPLPSSDFSAYLAFPDFQEDLLTELDRRGVEIFFRRDNLVLASSLSEDPVWAQCVWYKPEVLRFESIGEAVKLLKNRSGFWANLPHPPHRRANLIQEQLLRVAPKKMDFQGKLPQKSFGAWTLWDAHHLLAAAHTNSVFPLGLMQFNESNTPPSRAYLKLWEVFTRFPHLAPTSHQRVIDLGSAPGGWSWVLGPLASQVISVDKADLDETVAQLSHIQHLRQDAFQLKPSDVPPIDIIFSDLICEPPRLLELVQRWKSALPAARFICTIKYKGKTDFDITDEFLKLAPSKVIHLCHNKHEVTWIYPWAGPSTNTIT